MSDCALLVLPLSLANQARFPPEYMAEAHHE